MICWIKAFLTAVWAAAGRPEPEPDAWAGSASSGPGGSDTLDFVPAAAPVPSSAWRARGELLWARVQLRVGSVAHSRSEIYGVMAERYWGLANHYDRKGSKQRACRLREKAVLYLRAPSDEDPPPAVAVALARPRPASRVPAVWRRRWLPRRRRS